MPSHPRIARLLVDVNGFKNVKPVILVSGVLGTYYISTEKLAQDGGEFAKYGDDSQAMINHAYRMTQEHPTFDEVINILAAEVEKCFEEKGVPRDLRAISGGQRRDWLFSGPIAKKLGYHHISLYKDGHLYMIHRDGTKMDAIPGLYTSHNSDLLTKGSSTYDPRKKPPTGWVPMMWNAGLHVSDFSAVVSRLQGGEDVLAKIGLNARTFVQIDEAFLGEHSKQPEIDIDYVKKGAEQWGNEYLEREGIDAFVDAFAGPALAKDNRAAKFLAVYDKTLKATGLRESLRENVQEKYGFDIDLLPPVFESQEE
jgi:hypothetical protein